MIEFKNKDDIKYIKVILDDYQENFLLESKLTIKGIEIKVKQSLINEKIFKPIKEIKVISLKNIKDYEDIKDSIKVNSYTAIGIYVRWALTKDIKPITKIDKIFEILNNENAFYNNYELYFKPFGVVQFINTKLDINISFKNSEELCEYIKKHFNIC
ncbi:MAG: hypothetical protein ACRCYA_06455 [Cetobacterium sp.]|uniref:hypothetical protein n=1 Tax=Cetobacterium sp. TaxID=2071632 RepID=UPI003F31146B